MTLTLHDVQRIAQLAQLSMTPDEQNAMHQTLGPFFELAQRMSSLDTQGIEPLYTPLAAVRTAGLRLRPDLVTAANQRELNQRSAPATVDGLYLVPQVIES